MKKKGETFIAEDFELSAATLEWLETKYPQVDAGETLERFICSAEAHGWMYANWQRAFQNIVRAGMDKGWRSIVTLKQEKAKVDIAWQNILSEARKFGFREPKQDEGIAVYRSELEFFKRAAKPVISNVINLGGVLKKVV